MHAKAGDWLVVKNASDTRRARRGEIVAVPDHGRPPFTVRWTDTGRTTLVFPGPDAEVLTHEGMARLDAEQVRQAALVQDAIRAHER